jgi:putative mRNA 3-end processing factor
MSPPCLHPTVTDVRLRDGVEIDLPEGRLVADGAAPDGAIAAYSHAHGDHLYDADGCPAEAVCSELTAALGAARRDGVAPEPVGHPDVELLEAGHVAGSRAVLADTGDRRVLYTGDCSVRDRFLLEGFDPPPADVLVIEATYGQPGYEFAPQQQLERAILEWLDDTLDRPVVLFGYALGRAQELQQLLARSDRSRVLVTDAIARLNGVIAEHTGASFDVERREGAEPGPGEALVLPSGLNNTAWVQRLVESAGALTAGFSGWAVDRSFRFRGGYDEAFVLSDHCDFTELVGVVEAVDPERVYTQHGFADELARELTTRGYDARALKRDQSTLGEF